MASAILVVVGLAGLGILGLAFVPLSRGPSFATTPPVKQASPSVPLRPPAVKTLTPKTKPKSTKPQRAGKPKTGQNERPAAKTPTNRRASKPPPPPKPRTLTLTKAQRAVSWRRYPKAAYYEVYLRRGAKTLYETKRLRPDWS